MRCKPAFFALLILLVAAPAGAQTAVNRKYKETSLGLLPREVQDSAVVSPDARHVAYIRDGNTLVLDGQPQKTYHQVSGVNFSPNGKWPAYAASDGKSWFVVVGMREEAPYQRVGEPVFGPDSKRLAYVAQQADGTRVVVVNSKPGKPYDRIFDGRIVFSGDGQHLAYGALSGEKWHLVVDEQEGPAVNFFGSSSGICLSQDGSQVACAVLIHSDKEHPAWGVMIHGKVEPPYQEIADIALSRDGKRLAYAALKDDKWRVVVDGKEQKPYDTIAAGTLQFSADGAQLIYAAQADKKWRIVYNGREEPVYDGIADVLLSPNGKLLAYTAQVGRTEMVVLNNRPQRIYDRVGGGTLVFSANSKRLGYVAHSGKATFVVVDGKRKERYDRVGYLNFSPDAEHFAYAATRGNAAAFTVVDDLEAAHHYEAIWNVRGQKLLFDQRKKFHYLGLKQGSIFLVEEEID
jgi:WD40 repeat protein